GAQGTYNLVRNAIVGPPARSLTRSIANNAARMTEEERNVARILHGDIGQAAGDLIGMGAQAITGSLTGSPTATSHAVGTIFRIIASGGLHLLTSPFRAALNPANYVRAGTALWGTMPQMESEAATIPGNPAALQ